MRLTVGECRSVPVQPSVMRRSVIHLAEFMSKHGQVQCITDIRWPYCSLDDSLGHGLRRELQGSKGTMYRGSDGMYILSVDLRYRQPGAAV